MDDLLRLALYLVPEGALGAFGAGWLAWDMGRGAALPTPEAAPYDWAGATAEARRYGFHATIKPPFRLAEGASLADLQAATAALCATLAPVGVDGLRLADLDGFLALVPDGDTTALHAFAARVVTELDAFRRPAEAQELARRRAAGLSPRQEDYLTRWGYPYVLDEFRAHFTLTGRLGSRAEAYAAHLADRLAGVPLRPFVADSLCLVGEQAAGGFRLVHRYALTG